MNLICAGRALLASYDIVLEGDPAVHARSMAPISTNPFLATPAIWKLTDTTPYTSVTCTGPQLQPAHGRYADLIDYHQNSVRK